MNSTTADGSCFRAWAPALAREVEPTIPIATPSEVEDACERAAAAFDAFREVEPADRARLLEKIADRVELQKQIVLERAELETALPMARLELEFVRTVNQLRLFAGYLRAGEGADVVIEAGSPNRALEARPDLRRRQVPIGPVAVFGSSNFPLAFSVAGGDAAAALAAGCPVIVKGHPAHPGTAALVGKCVEEAISACGLPEGVFALLQSPSNDLGAAIVQNRHVKGVGFTGSRRGGLALATLAAQRPEPIPVFAEMSSVNPIILLPGALMRRAEAMAEGYVASFTLAGGQLCTKPGIVIAMECDGFDRFVDAARRRLSDVEPQVMLSPAIADAYSQGVSRLSEAPGVDVVGSGAECTDRGARARLFVTDATTVMRTPELAGEVFGASSLIIRARDEIEVRAVLDVLEGQLAAGLHVEMEDRALATALFPLLERKAGRILVNGWPTGIQVSHAIVHGGPFPATSDSRFTSVGTSAIQRFLRPVCYQDVPCWLLPAAVRSSNPLALRQRTIVAS